MIQQLINEQATKVEAARKKRGDYAKTSETLKAPMAEVMAVKSQIATLEKQLETKMNAFDAAAASDPTYQAIEIVVQGEKAIQDQLEAMSV